ncbi:hypothetical protein COL940_012480 [Colletotrichum noveboracense]|nr:hypothetical protein COL940_012480 [Colletotrichum noveboracense]
MCANTIVTGFPPTIRSAKYAKLAGSSSRSNRFPYASTSLPNTLPILPLPDLLDLQHDLGNAPLEPDDRASPALRSQRSKFLGAAQMLSQRPLDKWERAALAAFTLEFGSATTAS